MLFIFIYSTIIIIKNPNIHDWDWKVYLAPFKWTVWGVMMGIMVLLGIGIYMINHLQKQHAIAETNSYNLQDSLFCVLCGYIGQGKKLKSSPFSPSRCGFSEF